MVSDDRGQRQQFHQFFTELLNTKRLHYVSSFNTINLINSINWQVSLPYLMFDYATPSAAKRSSYIQETCDGGNGSEAFRETPVSSYPALKHADRRLSCIRPRARRYWAETLRSRHGLKPAMILSLNWHSTRADAA